MQMDLGVLEGQTRGDYFLDSIFDPSVKQCNEEFKNLEERFTNLIAVADEKQEDIEVLKGNLAEVREERQHLLEEREHLLEEHRRSRQVEEHLRSNVKDEKARSARVEEDLRSRVAEEKEMAAKVEKRQGRRMVEERSRNSKVEEELRSRLADERSRSAEVEEELKRRLRELMARNQQLEVELQCSQVARPSTLESTGSQLARPSIVSQLATLANSQPRQMEHALANPLPTTKHPKLEQQANQLAPVSHKCANRQEEQQEPMAKEQLMRQDKAARSRAAAGLPSTSPGAGQPLEPPSTEHRAAREAPHAAQPTEATPTQSRLVAKLVARPDLAGMEAADVGRLVARVREERGELTGLGVGEIAAEVRRLGREEECPVCLDTMMQGELTRCTRCRQLFHSRWGMGELCSKAQSLKSKLLIKVFYINHYFAVILLSQNHNTYKGSNMSCGTMLH